MHTQYAAAFTLFTALAITGPGSAQPRPGLTAPQQPGSRSAPPPPTTAPPSNLPGGPAPAQPSPPSAAPATDSSVSTAANYPSEIAGRKLEEWIKDLESPDPSIREGSIRVIVQFGPPARRAIPALVKQVRLLNDLSPQASAIIALSELVPLAPPPAPGSQPDGYTKDAVDALAQCLDSTQAIIRFRAATALAWLGPPARNAVPKLIARIDDRYSWEIRKAVCVALGSIGRDEQGWPIVNALEALGRGASDRDSRDVRIEALQAIINLGPAYGNVVPAQLLGVLRQRQTAERDKAVAIWVRVAVMRMDPAAVTDANISLISKQMFAKPGTSLEVRVQAAKALGFMGPLAKPGLSDMIEALQKSEEKVLTVQLCWSLARMAQFAERAIPALNQIQEAQKDDWVRGSAKVAIETIDKAIQQAKAAPPLPPKP
jgi:HEAT repeat protein